MHRTLILGILILLVGCCKQAAPSNGDKGISFRAKAGEIFESNIVIIPNEDGEVAIMYPKVEMTNLDPMPTLSIVVYNRVTDEILHRATVVRGSVEWHNNEEVHIWSKPGQISKDEPLDEGYYFNIITKKTRK